MAAAGLCSRRQAEEYIRAGRIRVNGEVAALGDQADAQTDTVELDGKEISLTRGDMVYIMLNKPTGYVTTLSDEKGRKDVSMLVGGIGTRVYPVGRLDLNSSGLLLMTNDGELAYTLMHPKHEVEKVYLVGAVGDRENAEAVFAQPMALDGKALAPFSVRYVRSARSEKGQFDLYRFTIHEGRNRQVRRMCALAGLDVLWLKRIAEGKLRLGDLPSGQWRYLTEEEIRYIKDMGTGGNAHGN